MHTTTPPRPRDRRSPLTVLVVLLLLLAAACGGDSEVGSDELLQGTGGGEGNLSLGSTSTTAVPSADTMAPQATTAPPTTAPAAPPPTEPADKAALEIEIRGDDVSPQINPSVARVFAGSTIRWRNVDSVPRSVRADDGSFASGELAPGATFEHTFNTPGTVNYKDGTRPYVTAQIEVIAQ